MRKIIILPVMQVSQTFLKSFGRFPAVLVAVVGYGLAGCTPSAEVRGYVPDEALIAEIRPGVDNRDSIIAMMGTPTLRSTFDEQTWYYVTQTSVALSFFKERPLARQILAMHFDDAGNLEDLKYYDLSHARDIKHTTRTTPTRGRELGFFQQILGNIGRFGGSQSRVPGQ